MKLCPMPKLTMLNRLRRLSPKMLKVGLSAGLTTALVAIPDGIASAMLASSHFMVVSNTGALGEFSGAAKVQALIVRVEHGMPEVVIPDLLRDTAADLVVVGKHGSSEIVDLFLGSMTNHLLREAGCDVLVVPPALEIKT